tara:strand:+ start:1209 stop:1427 length:219 start_codon:yes stop_codon:yes gene_type:complete
MFKTIKVTLLTWCIVFLFIFIFTIFVFWVGVSMWWIITNNMIDRNTFLLISGTITIGISILFILSTVISPEK